MHVNMYSMIGSDLAAEVCCAPLSCGAMTEADAERLATVLKALADPVRLRLVSLVTSAPGGEVCACDLPALVDRTQPTVSHHLGILVKAGILDRSQRGKWAWFSVRPGQLAALCQVLSPATDCYLNRS
jgi:ArsR family transcriptional regulator, arsenate/arsenite/antimonite-responsive transcriptional repressor